jgi:uncharacterized membrane protein
MTRERASAASRVRAAIYGLVTLAFAVLFTVIAVRIVPGGEWLEIVITVILAVGLWLQALRWLRRVKRGEGTGSGVG